MAAHMPDNFLYTSSLTQLQLQSFIGYQTTVFHNIVLFGTKVSLKPPIFSPDHHFYSKRLANMRRLSMLVNRSAREPGDKNLMASSSSSSSSQDGNVLNVPSHKQNKSLIPSDMASTVKKNNLNLSPMSRKQLIEIHRSGLELINNIKAKTNLCQRALYELENAYETSAGTCPCFRYVEVKDMILATIHVYHIDIVEDGDEEDLPYSVSHERLRLLGPLARLRESAKKFAMTEHEWLIVTTEYEDEDLRKQVERNCREVVYLSKELNNEDMKFVQMERRYQQIKDYCFPRKYSRMKVIIEEATKDCLTSNSVGYHSSSQYLFKKLGS